MPSGFSDVGQAKKFISTNKNLYLMIFDAMNVSLVEKIPCVGVMVVANTSGPVAKLLDEEIIWETMMSRTSRDKEVILKLKAMK